MKVFAERFKELRNESGLSAMKLGKLLGVSDVTILRWENNKADITGENLVNVAKHFGVSTDYLLGLED